MTDGKRVCTESCQVIKVSSCCLRNYSCEAFQVTSFWYSLAARGRITKKGFSAATKRTAQPQRTVSIKINSDLLQQLRGGVDRK
jgi:hypothetical protein